MRRTIRLTGMIWRKDNSEVFIFTDPSGKEYELDHDGSKECEKWKRLLMNRVPPVSGSLARRKVEAE